MFDVRRFRHFADVLVEPRSLDRDPSAIVCPVVFEDDSRLTVSDGRLDAHRLTAGRGPHLARRWRRVGRETPEPTRHDVPVLAVVDGLVGRSDHRLGTVVDRSRVARERCCGSERDCREQQHDHERERFQRALGNGHARERSAQLRREFVRRLVELVVDALDR
ncbi:hypothetical protein C472_00399 [Halorubrum tebenquichense DSM 14210]|uniref:Uncharacterized protein n=1 Tax=Halorubrum tebenquichense DSM 14210 TaxID=1227485 RepID=M0E4K8_9EURY|nr:hypothetical protein C472_00399 [Halorubrum tebenquichense DSM 14210]